MTPPILQHVRRERLYSGNYVKRLTATERGAIDCKCFYTIKVIRLGRYHLGSPLANDRYNTLWMLERVLSRGIFPASSRVINPADKNHLRNLVFEGEGGSSPPLAGVTTASRHRVQLDGNRARVPGALTDWTAGGGGGRSSPRSRANPGTSPSRHSHEHTRAQGKSSQADTRHRHDHDGNIARLARRSDEALGVRVSVARIAPSLLDLGSAGSHSSALSREDFPYFGLPIGGGEESRPLTARRPGLMRPLARPKPKHGTSAHPNPLYHRGSDTLALRTQACGLAGVLPIPLVPLQGTTGAGCRSPPGLSARVGISPDLLQHTESTPTSTSLATMIGHQREPHGGANRRITEHIALHHPPRTPHEPAPSQSHPYPIIKKSTRILKDVEERVCVSQSAGVSLHETVGRRQFVGDSRSETVSRIQIVEKYWCGLMRILEECGADCKACVAGCGACGAVCEACGDNCGSCGAIVGYVKRMWGMRIVEKTSLGKPNEGPVTLHSLGATSLVAGNYYDPEWPPPRRPGTRGQSGHLPRCRGSPGIAHMVPETRPYPACLSSSAILAADICIFNCPHLMVEQPIIDRGGFYQQALLICRAVSGVHLSVTRMCGWCWSLPGAVWARRTMGLPRPTEQRKLVSTRHSPAHVLWSRSFWCLVRGSSLPCGRPTSRRSVIRRAPKTPGAMVRRNRHSLEAPPEFTPPRGLCVLVTFIGRAWKRHGRVQGQGPRPALFFFAPSWPSVRNIREDYDRTQTCWFRFGAVTTSGSVSPPGHAEAGRKAALCPLQALYKQSRGSAIFVNESTFISVTMHWVDSLKAPLLKGGLARGGSVPGSTPRKPAVVRQLASYLGEPGSIPGGVAPRFFACGESCRTMQLTGGFFTGVSCFPRPCSPALLHIILASPSPSFSIINLGAAQISPFSTARDSLVRHKSRSRHRTDNQRVCTPPSKEQPRHSVFVCLSTLILYCKLAENALSSVVSSDLLTRKSLAGDVCVGVYAWTCLLRGTKGSLWKRPRRQELAFKQSCPLQKAPTLFHLRHRHGGVVGNTLQHALQQQSRAECSVTRCTRISRTLASHQGEPGSCPGRVTGLPQVRILAVDATGRRVFSGYLDSYSTFIPRFTLCTAGAYQKALRQHTRTWRNAKCGLGSEGGDRRSRRVSREVNSHQTRSRELSGAGLKIEMKFIWKRRNWRFEISIRDQQPSSTNPRMKRELRLETWRGRNKANMEQSWNIRAEGNGISPRKPADRRNHPARFPHAKIQSDPAGIDPVWARTPLSRAHLEPLIENAACQSGGDSTHTGRGHVRQMAAIITEPRASDCRLRDAPARSRKPRGGRGGVVVRLPVSHPSEPGSIPGGIAFRIFELTPDDAAGLASFLWVLPVTPPLHSEAALYSPRFTRIGSQDLDVNNRPYLSTSLEMRTTPDAFPQYRRHRCPNYPQWGKLLMDARDRNYEATARALEEFGSNDERTIQRLDRPGNRRARDSPDVKSFDTLRHTVLPSVPFDNEHIGYTLTPPPTPSSPPFRIAHALVRVCARAPTHMAIMAVIDMRAGTAFPSCWGPDRDVLYCALCYRDTGDHPSDLLSDFRAVGVLIETFFTAHCAIGTLAIIPVICYQISELLGS
ncbi:hypothetical protein PR048_031264 [Dryococelus australis]|uniref:Uncharacterized protein n=1 Tax=Dryococelus australis TaxID=614101 RepID=A0ABQ9G7N2_9NEOP|nr:hypothetical protein PR048_031264 [Dryococelus australis]